MVGLSLRPAGTEDKEWHGQRREVSNIQVSGLWRRMLAGHPLLFFLLL